MLIQRFWHSELTYRNIWPQAGRKLASRMVKLEKVIGQKKPF